MSNPELILDTKSVETKRFGGHVLETKESVVNDVRVGMITGYIAAWSVDTGGAFGMPDKFMPGAFLDSLAEHKLRSRRQIRLKDMHNRVIGGFPIESAFEDSVGLYAEGHINLETQLGAEAWALIKQGVLTDLSIGFSSLEDRVDDGIRIITKAIVWEGSVVDEPANRDALILDFKNAMSFEDLPLADRSHEWEPDEALNRVREFADAQDDTDAEWKKAFVHASGQTLQHAFVDVVDGELKAIPQAIIKTAESVMTAEFEGKSAAIRHLERYFAKMNMDSPFDAKNRQFFGIEETKSLEPSDLEEALRRGAAFSKGAAKLLTSRLKVSEAKVARYDPEKIEGILADLRGCSDVLGRGDRS